MDDIACIADMRSAARRRLPRAVFDFIDGGAEDERTLAENREGFARIRFAPRVLRDVSNRSLATRILGEPSAAPLFIAPTGLAALACPAADVHLAQAAAGAGIPFTLSTSASATIEEVATATSTAGVAHSRNWFQLYVFRNREVTHDLMDRALASGYRTLVVTLDVPVLGKRERDLRNRFTVPLRPTLAGLWDLMLHPRWCAQVLRAGTPRLKNYTGYASGVSTASLAAWINSELDPTLCWDDIRALRARWPGPMLLKGIVRADDVLAARQAGVDGVVISNHGGRQLDGAPATIDALRCAACQPRHAPGWRSFWTAACGAARTWSRRCAWAPRPWVSGGRCSMARPPAAARASTGCWRFFWKRSTARWRCWACATLPRCAATPCWTPVLPGDGPRPAPWIRS